MARISSKPEEVNEPGQSPANQLDSFLKTHKEEHYNYEEDVDYHVSSGSLNLDMEIGGFGPGVHRLVGPPSSGKTSEAFEIMRNFFAMVPNSLGVYIKTEGRLSDEMIKRSGLKFTSDPAEWKPGTVFVFKCNVYETIIGFIRTLISPKRNTSKVRYMFVVDSADAVNLKGDLDKDIEEGIKVAGSPLLTKQFLQKCALGMAVFGHMTFFLGQVSSEIKIDPYAKTVPRQVGGSGGNAVQHFSNEVLDYMEGYSGNLIKELPDKQPDRFKNKILGHVCKVRIAKSDREKRHVVVEIPIRYGQSGGASIWREREVRDQLLAWGLLERKGAWYYLNEALGKELYAALPKAHLIDSIQGEDAVLKWLDENKDVTKYLYDLFLKKVLSTV
jgi:RecA/RadA recombinase